MPSRNPSRLLSFLVLSLLGGALRAETTIPFLTERYFPAAGGAAFESIAWNPLTHTLASQDAIRDLCGSFVSTGPAESPGLAWDAVTATYWEITSTRMVRQWNGGTLVDTLFTIPQTFTVPGSGPDTLESVRGIAVDPSFVYVVDAGPDPGEIASNAWFKFTRTGVPVKSSKSTDFTSHLDADPDALVDDIVYVPPTSPVAPGLFLLAFEHSGIYVLTSEGEFRGKLLWSALDIPANLALRAFAGITIDPATGDLFLVDNDAGKAQVWTRIPQDGPTWYAIGSYGTVDHPGSCTRYLWGAAGTPPQTLMGVAYRPADELVYEVDYSTGQLWRFDPMLRTATFAGNTGRSDLWGLAYDTERDVFYVGQDLGGSTQIYSVNPTTYATAPLSQVTAYSLTDLAFNATDRNLYAISGDLVTPRLVRINRNTGAGTIVGTRPTSEGSTSMRSRSGSSAPTPTSCRSSGASTPRTAAQPRSPLRRRARTTTRGSR